MDYSAKSLQIVLISRGLLLHEMHIYGAKHLAFSHFSIFLHGTVAKTESVWSFCICNFNKSLCKKRFLCSKKLWRWKCRMGYAQIRDREMRTERGSSKTLDMISQIQQDFVKILNDFRLKSVFHLHLDYDLDHFYEGPPYLMITLVKWYVFILSGNAVVLRGPFWVMH